MDFNQMEKIIERLEHSLDKKVSDDKMKIIHQELNKRWWSAQRLKNTIDYLIETYEKYSFPTIAEILKAGERFPDRSERVKASISCDLCNGTGLVSATGKNGYRASFCCNEGHVINSEAYLKLRKWGKDAFEEGYRLDGSDGDQLDPQNESHLGWIRFLKQVSPKMYFNFIKSNHRVGRLFEEKLSDVSSDYQDVSKEIERDRSLKDDEKREAGYRVKFNPGDVVDVF